jgi:chromosome segregation ATPase
VQSLRYDLERVSQENMDAVSRLEAEKSELNTENESLRVSIDSCHAQIQQQDEKYNTWYIGFQL